MNNQKESRSWWGGLHSKVPILVQWIGNMLASFEKLFLFRLGACLNESIFEELPLKMHRLLLETHNFLFDWV